MLLAGSLVLLCDGLNVGNRFHCEEVLVRRTHKSHVAQFEQHITPSILMPWSHYMTVSVVRSLHCSDYKFFCVIVFENLEAFRWFATLHN